jgi:LCP family protein required for cell wall assembly
VQTRPSTAERQARAVRGPVSWVDLRRRIRTSLVVASALVLVLTGTAWGLYRDLTAGITTTDVIAGDGHGGAQNILIVGVDSRTDAKGNPLPPEMLRMLHSGADTGVLNSDTIMLLHVPEGGGAAVAFSIPRDSYVDIPGSGSDKINAAYPVTKARVAEELVADGVRDPAQVEAQAGKAGRSALIGAVEGLTGLTVDHYAEINLLGFYNLTTAIGGVDVCLKAAVDDELSGARFPAGRQTIAGADALAFVRQRHGLPGGDLSRIRRQQVFLAAVADKVLSAGTLADPAALGALGDVARQSLVIDDEWDVLAFARQASDIAAGNIEFVTIPTRGLDSNTRGDVVVVDRYEVRGFVEQRIEEREKAAAESAAVRPPPQPVDVIASRYVVDVRNGSATSGLAGAVATHLRSLGFLRGTVDNTEGTPTSVVRYTGADAKAAEAVAEQLGGIETDSVDDVTPGHLLVVIGADFDPKVIPSTATKAPPPPDAAAITAAGVPCVD